MVLVLKEIRIKGFRAFRDETHLDLAFPIIALVGPIGSGKSSIISAIEYALYGSTRDVKKRILRKSDLINDFAEELSVNLILREGDREYKIERMLSREGHEVVKLSMEEGDLYSMRANEFLRSLLGLDLGDFVRHVSVNHLDLQSLVYGPPAFRSRTLDKLLGIELLEGIFQAIQTQMVKDRLEEIAHELRGVERELEELSTLEELRKEIEAENDRLKEIEEETERVSAQVRELESVLGELEEKESKHRDLKMKEIRIETLLEDYKSRVREIRRRLPAGSMAINIDKLRYSLVEVLRELYLESEASMLENLEIREDKIDDALRTLKDYHRLAVRERERLLREINELAAEREYRAREMAKLEQNLASLRTRVEELEEARRRHEELMEKFESPANIEKMLKEARIRLREAMERLKELECRVSLEKDLVARMGRPRVECPVCGSTEIDWGKLKKLFERNAKMVAKSRREKISKLEREVEHLDKVKLEAEGLERTLSLGIEALASYNELKEHYEDELRELEEMEETLKSNEEKLSFVDRYLGSIESGLRELEEYLKLSELSSKIRELEARSKDIREELQELSFNESLYLNLRKEYLNAKSELERLRAEKLIAENNLARLGSELEHRKQLEERREALRSEMARAKKLNDILLRVKNVYRELQADLREEMLSILRKHINQVFIRVYPYGDYDLLDIKVVRSGETMYERSIYEIYARRAEDGRWVSVTGRLSDGQKMVVAFCLVAALFKLYNHNLGFLILDEPTPNVDAKVKEAIVSLLGDETGIRQIVIATQNQEIADRLKDRAKVYHLSGGTLS